MPTPRRPFHFWRSAMSAFLLATVALTGSAGHVVASPPRQAAEPLAWVHLGPSGPLRVRHLAVAPAWPEDPFILAARENDLVRSLDAGRTWERFELPAPNLTSLTVAPTADSTMSGAGRRIAFASTRESLYRSPDGGATWQPVPSFPPTVSSRIAISPAFGSDSLAFAMAGARLLRTRDAGLTWEEQDLGGQRVQDLVLSPHFATDRTSFLAVITGPFNSLNDDSHYWPVSAGRDPQDHIESRGVLVSTDGGESWNEATVGLGVAGAPFRHVRALTISPTFAQDGTLFAFAWGPREMRPYMGGQARMAATALFKSTDRGASWQPAFVHPSFQIRRNIGLAFSPAFAADGVVLMTNASSALSPASASCTVSRSADWGATWTAVIPGGSYEGCGPVYLAGVQGSLVAAVQKGPGPSWYFSADAGATWDSRPPRGGIGPIVPSRGAFVIGVEAGGVYALGPNLTTTSGSLPCATPLQFGFGRLWQTETWVRSRLGCPLEAERPVRVREGQRDTGPGSAPAVELNYWTEDDLPDWFGLAASDSSTGNALALFRKSANPWPHPSGATRTLDGVVQGFEGGHMLFLIHADGRRAI